MADSLNKQFWLFLFSSILIALSGCLGNIVDGIIVGNFIGEDGVSAINLSKPIVQLMFSMSLLLANGAGMIIGVAIGRQAYEKAASVFTLSLIGCLLFGLLMTLCGIFFTTPLTHLLCSHDLLFADTHAYLRPMLLGAPMYMLAWGMATLVSVDGSPRLASISILADNAVNLVLNIVLIRWCHMGIAGSSLATVLGHAVGIAIMCLHFLRPNNHLHFKLQITNYKLQISHILSQGLPLSMASICLSVLFYCANSIVLHSMGRVGIFAFAVCMNLLQVYNMFNSGASRTLQSLGAIQIGKGDNATLIFIIRKSFRFISVAMLLACVAIWLFPESITRFFGADEPDLITEGAHALRIFAISFVPYCYLYTLMVVYKLYRYDRIALFISVALSLMVIPVLWLMAHFAPQQLWYGYLIAYLLDALILLICHFAAHVRFEIKI